MFYARRCKPACRRRSPRRRTEGWGVRDRLLNDALKRLAADAAVRFSGLVATGDQIPFDVAEQSGPDSLFYRYVPLTSRFVREREDELVALPTFAAARDAVEAAELAVPYLEARGEAVPADPGERAARVLTALHRLPLGRLQRVLARPRAARQRPCRPRRRGTRHRGGRPADRPDRRAADVRGAAAAPPRGADRARRHGRRPDRGDAQRGHGTRRLGAPVPGPGRPERRAGRPRRGAAPASRADQRDATFQAGRRRARSPRVRPHRGRSVAAPRHRRPRDPPRRV